MADIFVSYTSSDSDRAHWVDRELGSLGHTARLYEKEVRGGDNFYRWIRERFDAADHVLCVISNAYLQAIYSLDEFDAALKHATERGHNFLLPVVFEPCDIPRILGPRDRCELFGISEDEKSKRFRAFADKSVPEPIKLSGHASNIPIAVPQHFMGRTDELDKIHRKLGEREGRVAITALHGLRGVGKTMLAAAYAEQHRHHYRATWWIRAETEAGMRADLVGLGVRLDWVPADVKEEPALAAVLDRLRQEGDGILLIYDNAVSADTIRSYLPRGGAPRIIVTSNSHAWRGLAEPVEIEVWPREIGANYLIARTGRTGERVAAEDLSAALGGLPLAHEQAGAYCERLEVPLSEYRLRFEATPARLLDSERDVARDYGRTVSKTFALAIDEAIKLHPAAEPLLVYAALLAPEPIPLFLFAEGREKFEEPLASALADDGLEEAVAALRTFALLAREQTPDERDPTITTDAIRLHQLVRRVAALRCVGASRQAALRTLIEAMSVVYPRDVDDDPRTWPRARRLDASAMALVADASLPDGTEVAAQRVMNQLAGYRQFVLAAHGEARPLFERMLALTEQAFGPEHRETATSLNNLAALLQQQGNLSAARPLLERALAISEKTSGPEHPDTATSLSNLAIVVGSHGDLAAARSLLARALKIDEKVYGLDHPEIVKDLNNIAGFLLQNSDFASAHRYLDRALVISEKTLGSRHPLTATTLTNLAFLLHNQRDLEGARPIYERALGIREKVLGTDHPQTLIIRKWLAALDAQRRSAVAMTHKIPRKRWRGSR